MENETAELKGGHAPAVKVGGVRIVQHKPKEEKEVAGKPSEEEKEEFGEDAPVKAPSTVLVSGAKASEESAYPEEAVKAYHVKPVPTHTKGASTKPKVIHQPTK